MKWNHWHWLIKLYRFHMYNSITNHMHIASCSHRPERWQKVVPFCHHVFPPCPLPPPPSPFPSGCHHTAVCVYVSHIYLLNPFTFFHQVPQPSSPLTDVSLFYVSMLLCKMKKILTEIFQRRKLNIKKNMLNPFSNLGSAN